MIGAARAIAVRVLRALAPWRLAVVALATVGLVVLGLVFHLDIGSLCAVCPLGLAQISAASRSVSPMLAWSILAFAAVALFFGRLLCAWLCPTNLLPWRRGVLAASRRRGRQGRNALPARTVVLVAGTVGVSFLVGFPVFCLFCPIGLFFGFLYALAKAFTVYTPSWDLIVFPLVLFFEFGLFRRWCSAICPLGALMSLIGRARPRPPRSPRLRTAAQDGTKRGSSSRAFSDGLDAGHGASACESCGKCRISAGAGNVLGAHDDVLYSKKGEVR